MSLNNVNAGRDVPNDFNVVIEIPMNGDPIKYEVDKESGAIFVDRFMGTAMHYPCNYGYVPNTIADDGDPCDVLVITPFPLLPGVVVRCRALGVLKMTDEAGGDAKILAVPVDKMLPMYSHWQDRRDVPDLTPAPDPALLRALQGPGKRQVGQGRRLGRPGRRQGRNPEWRESVRRPAEVIAALRNKAGALGRPAFFLGSVRVD
jgi:inorganic pyrophosphatase